MQPDLGRFFLRFCSPPHQASNTVAVSVGCSDCVITMFSVIRGPCWNYGKVGFSSASAWEGPGRPIQFPEPLGSFTVSNEGVLDVASLTVRA